MSTRRKPAPPPADGSNPDDQSNTEMVLVEKDAITRPTNEFMRSYETALRKVEEESELIAHPAWRRKVEYFKDKRDRAAERLLDPEATPKIADVDHERIFIQARESFLKKSREIVEAYREKVETLQTKYPLFMHNDLKPAIYEWDAEEYMIVKVK